jgi:thiol-disulfide isomerase/thioredoxin
MRSARLPVLLASLGIVAGCGQAPVEAPAPAPAPAPSAAAPADAVPTPPAELGPVHKLTVTDLDGNTVSLAKYAGRPMIIEIWATWCGPCRTNRATIHALKGRLPEKLAVVGISMDTGPELVKSFLRSNAANEGEYMASADFNSFVRSRNPSGLIPKTMYVTPRGVVADLAEGVQTAEWVQAMAKNLR